MRRITTVDGATAAAYAVGLALLVALSVTTYLLIDSQQRQREDLRTAYGQRAEIASGVVDSIFRVAFVGQAREAAQRYRAARPSTEQLSAAAREGNAAYTAIVDPSGEVVGASSAAPRDLARRTGTVPPHLRAALQNGYGLSDIQGRGRDAVVETAVAFESPFGRRIVLTGSPVSTFVTFLGGTLVRLPRVASGQAWVFDSRGRVLGKAGAARRIRTPPRALLRPARTGRFEGSDGPVYFQSEPLPSSRWRIVIAAPERELFSFIGGISRWLPWILLVFGALALVAIALLLRRLLQTAAALRNSNKELARSNADLEQFAYVASHDLSEPLRTVAGFSQLLGRRYQGKLDAEADLYIEHMGSGVERMQQLIDDLLVYSRVGREPVSRARVDLDELFAEVCESLGPAISERGGRVTSDDLPVVQGERTQLAQVLQNLISNGLKFTAPEVAPHVHVSAERREGMWRIAVRDNGIGIDKDEDVIFKMFGRLHPADAYPGTGIGLALVKRIVERHGGEVGVEPAPGGGSIFSFTLPDRSSVLAPEPVATAA